MQFKVREDYVVHLETVKEITRQGQTFSETQTTVYYGGDEVDMTPEQAALHAARIEAVDKAAAKFLDSQVLQSVVQPSAPSAIDPVALQAAVMATLTAMGVAVPPAAPAA